MDKADRQCFEPALDEGFLIGFARFTECYFGAQQSQAVLKFFGYKFSAVVNNIVFRQSIALIRTRQRHFDRADSFLDAGGIQRNVPADHSA
ncbi:hypothetical protein D3C84_705850 [compost metagenome]